MSASLPAAAAVLAIVAPAASNSASVMREPAPAPDCTATSAPRPMSFFTVSGEAATRVSSLSASAGTAIFIMGSCLTAPRSPEEARGRKSLASEDARGRLEEESSHQDEDHCDADRAPFRQADKEVV